MELSESFALGVVFFGDVVGCGGLVRRRLVAALGSITMDRWGGSTTDTCACDGGGRSASKQLLRLAVLAPLRS